MVFPWNICLFSCIQYIFTVFSCHGLTVSMQKDIFHSVVQSADALSRPSVFSWHRTCFDILILRAHECIFDHKHLFPPINHVCAQFSSQFACYEGFWFRVLAPFVIPNLWWTLMKNHLCLCTVFSNEIHGICCGREHSERGCGLHTHIHLLLLKESCWKSAEPEK